MGYLAICEHERQTAVKRETFVSAWQWEIEQRREWLERVTLATAP